MRCDIKIKKMISSLNVCKNNKANVSRVRTFSIEGFSFTIFILGFTTRRRKNQGTNAFDVTFFHCDDVFPENLTYEINHETGIEISRYNGKSTYLRFWKDSTEIIFDATIPIVKQVHPKMIRTCPEAFSFLARLPVSEALSVREKMYRFYTENPTVVSIPDFFNKIFWIFLKKFVKFGIIETQTALRKANCVKIESFCNAMICEYNDLIETAENMEEEGEDTFLERQTLNHFKDLFEINENDEIDFVDTISVKEEIKKGLIEKQFSVISKVADLFQTFPSFIESLIFVNSRRNSRPRD